MAAERHWKGTGMERLALQCRRAPVLEVAWADYLGILRRIELARRELDLLSVEVRRLAGFDWTATHRLDQPLRFRHVLAVAWMARTLPSQLVNVTMYDDIILSRPAMRLAPCPDVATYRVRNAVKVLMRMTHQEKRHVMSQCGVQRNTLDDVLHAPEDGEPCHLHRVPVLHLLVLLRGLGLTLHDALGARRAGEPHPRPDHQEIL